ncbi:MAG: hypothetical protein KC550_00065 [Nanoarchaeota archaeon]|nr:hypothetical protein [Nanoarchaeota archaeon]
MTFGEFIRCSFANKVALGGYILMGSSGLGEILESSTGINIDTSLAYCGGYMFLMVTNFGRETYEVYKNTKRSILKTGTVPSNYLKLFHNTRYCAKSGINLALKEFNLEYLLKNHQLKN